MLILIFEEVQNGRQEWVRAAPESLREVHPFGAKAETVKDENLTVLETKPKPIPWYNFIPELKSHSPALNIFMPA